MLTHVQRKLLMYLDGEARKGMKPTYKEAATAMGFLAESRVHRLVSQLEERGHVERIGRQIYCRPVREKWFAFDDETQRLVPFEIKGRRIVIKFKRLPNGEGLATPARATEGSAGIDLQSASGAVLGPGQWQAFGTGYAVEIPHGMEGQIRPRSGLAVRHGLTVLNSPGTIDNDFTGEVRVILINHSPIDSVVISRGDRIAQLVVAPITTMPIECVTELTETVRGDGGLGSTGT